MSLQREQIPQRCFECDTTTTAACGGGVLLWGGSRGHVKVRRPSATWPLPPPPSSHPPRCAWNAQLASEGAQMLTPSPLVSAADELARGAGGGGALRLRLPAEETATSPSGGWGAPQLGPPHPSAARCWAEPPDASSPLPEPPAGRVAKSAGKRPSEPGHAHPGAFRGTPPSSEASASWAQETVTMATARRAWLAR